MSSYADYGEGRLALARWPRWVDYAIVVVLEIALTAALDALMEVFPLGHYPIPYIVLTMLIAYTLGEGPAILSIIIGLLAFSYFFTPPRGVLWPPANTLEGWAREVAFILGALIVAIATIQARKSRQRIQRLADEASTLNVSLSAEMAEREAAAARLREHAGILQEQAHMLDLAHILIRDLDDRVIFWNRGAEALYGWSKEEALGKTTDELFRTVFPKPLDEIKAEVMREGEWQGELLHTRRDGSTIVLASHWVLHRDENGEPKAFIEVNNDITELKRVEEQREQAHKELDARAEELQHANETLWSTNEELEVTNEELRATTEDLRQEIEERKRANEALGQSEERYRNLFSSMSEAFMLCEIILDDDGKPSNWRYLEINPAFESNTGVKVEDAIGKTAHDVLPNIEAYWIEAFGHVALTGQSIRLEQYNQDLDRYFAASAYSAAKGQFAVLFVDVTERKKAEDEIRKLNAELEQRVIQRTSQLDTALKQEQTARADANVAEARTKSWLELAPDGIIIVTKDGAIAFANSRALEMFGYQQGELLDRPIETLVPERYHDVHLGHRADYVADPHTRPMGVGLELYGLRKDGTEFPVEISLSPTWTGSELTVTAIVRDTTARKQAEQEIKRLNEGLRQRALQLEVSNKELEAFSYSVSHDLRAPLRAIDGFSNALLKHYLDSLDARGQDYLQRVRAAAQRMAQLIDDILGLSRASRMEMRREQVDLSAVATDILTELQKSQPERKAEIFVAPDLIVNADAHLLRISLDNLLGNAWKFTGMRDVACIEVGAIERDGERVYYVKDNGAGFNPEYADKLFSPFQRLHAESEFPGTGIGLALVQRIIRRHGGRIWGESAVDQGATFYFTLEEAQP